MPVIKKYLKREDAPKTLSKRSIAVLNKRCLESVELEHPYPPQQIGDFMFAMSTKMNETKRKIEGGEISVKSIIEELPDQKIDALHQLFSNTSPGTYTEDNLLIASKLVVDDITVVEQSIEHLKHLKNDLIRNFANAYVYGYHQLQGSTDVKFNNKQFVKDLENIQSIRKGIRRVVEAPAEDVRVENNSQCSLM